MRVYPVLLRNDLPDNLLQVIDPLPDAPIDKAVNVRGSYITWFPQNDTVATSDSGGGVWTTDAAYSGLMAYILDNVEDVNIGADLTMLDADAATIAAGILARALAGQALELSDINTVIQGVIGISSDLDGSIAGSDSTGSVVDIMRILAGDVYQIAAGTAVSGAARAFLAAPVGAFLTRTQTGFRDRKNIPFTGAWNLSALSGQVSMLSAATYTWLNPSNTYGGTGDALFLGGGHIPATGIGRALAVYNEDGEVF